MRPLAELMRPDDLEDYIGQKHIVGKNKPLYNMIMNNEIFSFILYGPPGTGKTTLANIIAKKSKKKFYKLNATTATVKDIQEITSNLDNLFNYSGVVIYIDELQYFSKKQQQSLLEFVENGSVTMIASTTENPYFCIHRAILSRCSIFNLKLLTKVDILDGLIKAILKLNDKGVTLEYDESALEYIADICQGDLRKAYSILELAIKSQNEDVIYISKKYIKELDQSYFTGESSGSEFYNTLSAFQKSIRGSDADASIHYLARLVKSGNLNAIIRRLAVIAAEDIGLAHPNALSVVNSGIELVLKVGLPEAQLILSEIVIYLATLPKSNSAYIAIKNALKDLETKELGDIPSYLKDTHYNGAYNLVEKGYKYPHNYENNYIEQKYLPKELEETIYYKPQNNKYENSIENYWRNIK